MIQRRDKPDPATYIGSGKAARAARDRGRATGADTVICDGELSPAPARALEEVVKVKVIDRTALILDIFAQHATQPGGQGAGRAGPDAVHAAAAARLGRVDVPAGRRPAGGAAAASVPAAPVRPRSRPTAGGSGADVASCAARSRR